MCLLGLYEEITTMVTSGERPAQRIKTTHLKHKTLRNPIVCIMGHGLAKIGGAAEEARADEEIGTELESDGAPDSPTGSALGSFSKRLNPWNLVFKKVLFTESGKTDDAVNAFRESREIFLDSHARGHCVLDYPFVV